MRLPQHKEAECGAEAMRAASGGEWRRVHLPTRLSLLRRCCANLQARTWLGLGLGLANPNPTANPNPILTLFPTPTQPQPNPTGAHPGVQPAGRGAATRRVREGRLRR